MKRNLLWLHFIAALLLGHCYFLSSCSKDSDNGASVPVVEPVIEPETSLPPARITEVIRNADAKATVWNIEYPSSDPFGNPVTLSGSIIIGDEVEAEKSARGMALYNHFTVFEKNQCPSNGDLGIVLKIAGSGLIAVAADYYGFGVTGDRHQAYCISRVNAQASVDALLAARELLKEKGYQWGDFLFNMGYSEGGQTSMGVLRLCAEQYPDIKFTHTIAGGGPYDIGETYRQLVSSGETSMPSTVISTLLAYNEFFQLGVPDSDMLLEPTLSNVAKYLLSMDYTREELEGKLASTKIVEWIHPSLLDFDSQLSRLFMAVFEQDNLSKGWTPRKTERISLVHNERDACVPYSNTTQMMAFFKGHGFTVTDSDSDLKFTDGCVFVTHGNWDFSFISPKLGTHESGAVPFIIEIITVVCHYLDIPTWFTFNPSDLQGVRAMSAGLYDSVCDKKKTIYTK